MAQTMQAPSAAPHDVLALEARNDRLQTLVGELLRTNEELRLKMAQLEQKAEHMGRALDDTSAIYGLLLP